MSSVLPAVGDLEDLILDSQIQGQKPPIGIKGENERRRKKAIDDVKYDETAANNTKIVEVLTSMSSRSIERDQEKALDRQKKAEAREMQLHYLAMMSTEREQRKEDHAILSMNMSTFNPTQKAYYEGLQREIIARRGF
ncbi:hypothetical protein RHGRI_005716 [Rhododendron griersonianum]|uniref:No apical meristem-associated C-terminal domain-containing protein n=1 Tax=Rhododendron griersonianum TaxID=479676 RepID=A0AAV6LEI6_9ERIC|nr:hypothetical protein RHGRI_005716 [Rhododendron griersonianum]